MQKIVMNNLVIEVTRKCNLTCAHCLRGAQQQKTISDIHLSKIMKQFSAISTITFSGGEPSLAPDRLTLAREYAKKYDVEVQNFFVVTNGVLHKKTNEFIIELMHWWTFCTDNEISGVDISASQFHKACTPTEINYDKHPLRALNFCNVRGELKHLYDKHTPSLINEGRASSTTFAKRGNSNREVEIEEYEDNLPRIIGDSIYINALGDIVIGCDWSYKSQLRKKIGNVDNGSILEQIKKYIQQDHIPD